MAVNALALNSIYYAGNTTSRAKRPPSNAMLPAIFQPGKLFVLFSDMRTVLRKSLPLKESVKRRLQREKLFAYFKRFCVGLRRVGAQDC
jgi:hypothetical protein